MPAEKVEILTDNGTTVKAIAPVIISASRSTDIPAYFPKWFATRFNGGRGYVKWFNPFNQKPVFVSFEKTKVIVFWTKNPKPLIPYLPQLDAAGVHYYFHFTLNDYQQENLEPNVPSLESRIQTFKELASLLGPERIVWRFDPVLFTKTLTPRELATRIFKISKKLKGCTNRLVFSFIDIKVYDFKAWQADQGQKKSVLRAVSSALWTLTVAVYFLISFYTRAWHTTWIIFLIAAAEEQLLKACFDLKR